MAFKYRVKEGKRSKHLYLSISSTYSLVSSLSSQKISVKLILGDIIIAKINRQELALQKAKEKYTNGGRPKGIFQQAEAQLFPGLTIEERKEEIKDLIRAKRKKAFDLAQGKNHVLLNTEGTKSMRMTGLRRKFKANIVGLTHSGKPEILARTGPDEEDNLGKARAGVPRVFDA